MNGPGRRARVRGILIDVAPLRHDRDFRWLWMGQVVSSIGTQITRIALPFQVFVLTGSTLAVAALTLAQLIPILVLALGAGSLADVVDRRRLLLVTQTALALCSGALMLVALSDPDVGALPILFVIAAVAAGCSAVDQPARSASIPRLVAPERLPAAIALNHLLFTMASIVGPAVGGLLIAWVGLSGAYLVDTLSFAATLVALSMMAPLPPLASATRPGLEAIREGLRFARDRRPILGSFVIDLNAMIFGMPTSLFPVLALEVFRTGPEGFGLLSAAPAAGAFLGAVTSGWVSRVERIGKGILLAVLAWGAAITAFGLMTFSFPLALACLALAGAADLISAVLRGTLVQLEAPDQLRGRITSIHTLVVTSGPRIGDIEAALVAAIVGPQAAVVSGGLLCIAGVGVVARRYPELSAYVRRAAPAQAAAPPLQAAAPTAGTPPDPVPKG